MPEGESEKTEEDRQKQQKALVYQLLQRRLQELQQESMVLEREIIQIESTKRGLDDVKKAKKGKDTLIPLGSGCYSPGKSVKVDKILVDVGAGIMVKKSIEEAKEFLDRKKGEVESEMEELQDEVQGVAQRMNQIAADLRGQKAQ